MIPIKVSIPEEHEPLICIVDVKGWSLVPSCLSNVSGTRTPSVSAAMTRTLGSADVGLGVTLRPSKAQPRGVLPRAWYGELEGA